MKFVPATCNLCGQPLIVEVDEEGLKFCGGESFLKLCRCDRCVELEESKKRSALAAARQPKSEREPF